MSLFDLIGPAFGLIDALSDGRRDKLRVLALELSEPVLRAGLAELKDLLPLERVATARPEQIAAALRVVAPELTPAQAHAQAERLKRLIAEA